MAQIQLQTQMVDGPSLPVLRDNKVSVLSLNAPLKSNASFIHPVHIIQTTAQKDHEAKAMSLGTVFGSHLPLRLNMERHVLTQFQRLPGLHSDFIGLETILGTDEEIQIEDYLNDPAFSEKSVDLHAAMEKKVFGY